MEIESGNKWQTSGNKFECGFFYRLCEKEWTRRRVEDNRVSYGVWHYMIAFWLPNYAGFSCGASQSRMTPHYAAAAGSRTALSLLQILYK